MKIANLVDDVKKRKSKFIVITGGVCSSIGKGVLVSSIGVLLKNAGYTVSVVKMDPYLNVDPGTMSPLEHGEVFVTTDGAETDLDLGHYERILGISLTKDSSVSSGQIFQEIIEGERKGKFLGRCIQLVPHVVDAIKKRLLEFALSHNVDFVLVEIGGTVGDIEGQVFLEAIRQLRIDLNSNNLFHGHLSYVPSLEWTGEIKTKPTQHSIHTLKQAGLAPDGLFLRAACTVPDGAVEKLSVMGGVKKDFIFQVLTYKPLYGLFSDLKKQGVGLQIQRYFGVGEPKDSDLTLWENLLDRIGRCEGTVKIGIVAKYVGNNDPYISVLQAIRSAAIACKVNVDMVVIDAEQLEFPGDALALLKTVDGVVGPGGFDVRGVEGKIAAVKWARENNIPYLGLCLGLQVMLLEIGRSLAGLPKATSTEFDKHAEQPVISLLEEQGQVENKGASMRLGTYACKILKETKAYAAYGQETVNERHRHRYEFNNKYKDLYEQSGVIFSGISEKNELVEVAEFSEHPFMLGTQAHPEFLSSPLKSHPLFKSFISAVLDGKERKK